MAGLTAFTNAQGDGYLNQYDFTPHAYTRTMPVQGGVQEAIANAVYSVDPELRIRVTSGGQTSKRDPALYKAANGWVGSERHNEGAAADFQLVRNGEVLPISANKAIYQSVARNLAAQGVPGIGVDMGDNFIHAGGGSEAAWGYRGGKNSVDWLDPDFATSIQEGRSMAQTGGIPRPPGLVTSPPGSAVGTQMSTAAPTAPVQPRSQSNALSRERSMISANASPELKASLARLASTGARNANLPAPATPSTAMRAARSPNLMDGTFGQIMRPAPRQPMAADMRATLANPATPFLSRDGQGVTSPAAAVFGGEMETNIGLPGTPPNPYPASVEDRTTARNRATTQQMAETQAATRAVLSAGANQTFAGQERSPMVRAPAQTEAQRLAALYATGGPTRPPVQTEAQRLAALYSGGGPTRPPVQSPMIAGAAPVVANPQVATQLAVAPPVMRPAQPAPARQPLRIMVNGANPIAPAAPQQPKLSSAQIYDALNAAARGALSLEDRITGRAYERSSNNGSLSSI